jgi:hypothetical protein
MLVKCVKNMNKNYTTMYRGGQDDLMMSKCTLFGLIMKKCFKIYVYTITKYLIVLCEKIYYFSDTEQYTDRTGRCFP